VNTFQHNREPADVQHQTVIRLNRDTLYSFAIVDLAGGATVTLPDAGDRYQSAMLVNEDHYINRILHGPGTFELSADELGSRYVALAVRTLVDPGDPADVAAVAALQDRTTVVAASAEPFASPAYDVASLDATRTALLELARGLDGLGGMFGRREEVDPVRHLIGTAAGWGGLPSTEAIYVSAAPDLPPGRYSLTVGEVPVDGFWSMSVYDAAGYFQPNARNAYSVNNITATRETDGSVVVHLGDWDEGTPNCIPLPEGWNYVVRLYRPRPELVDGTWTFPTLT
jgi:hypothetical protein